MIASHREGEIVVRLALRLTCVSSDEAADGCDENYVGESDQERESGHAGELHDLNHGPLPVERAAERVPTPAREKEAAHDSTVTQAAARRNARRRLWSELSQGEALLCRRAVALVRRLSRCNARRRFVGVGPDAARRARFSASRCVTASKP